MVQTEKHLKDKKINQIISETPRVKIYFYLIIMIGVVLFIIGTFQYTVSEEGEFVIEWGQIIKAAFLALGQAIIIGFIMALLMDLPSLRAHPNITSDKLA